MSTGEYQIAEFRHLASMERRERQQRILTLMILTMVWGRSIHTMVSPFVCRSDCAGSNAGSAKHPSRHPYQQRGTARVCSSHQTDRVTQADRHPTNGNIITNGSIDLGGYGRLAAGSPTSAQATIHRCYTAEDMKIDRPQWKSLNPDETPT